MGGRNILPMKELGTLLEQKGYKNVQTYIQSGNVVFQSNQKPGDDIGSSIEQRFGFKPEVIILSDHDFYEAKENNPYKSADWKSSHFYFCKSSPESVDSEKLERLKAGSEKYAIKGNVLYLYAPNGIGRSKLAASIEKCMGVPVTARNLNTVNKLSEMAKSR